MSIQLRMGPSNFEKLEKNDAVIGPALDGGYYLLGLKKMHPTIFMNKNWGTATVRKAVGKGVQYGMNLIM